MTAKWLELLEKHVEKGIVGLTALALLAMFYLYFVRSPNTVPYGDEEVSPRELYENIQEDALALERAVRSAAPDEDQEQKSEDFSQQLQKYHAQGIFASAEGQPGLPRELHRAATFGGEIEVPGLEEIESPSGSIVLVEPLPPSRPKARTGRALAVREPIVIPGLAEPGVAETPPEDEPSEPSEVVWVTVGAYFNKKAQYDEMIQAGYVPFRSKAYVVGVDVQRQEMLSNGEFSEWEDVEPTVAMPQLEMPVPLFDDETGESLNKDEIRRAFDAIKAAQPDLMQPTFYPIEAGDFWEMPPLEGYEEEDEEEEEEEGRTGRAPPEPGRTIVPIPTGPGRTIRGSGPRGPGGRTGGEAGPSRGAYSSARSDAERKREARRQIRRDLVEIGKLLNQKEYGAARDLASRIVDSEFATAGNRRKAKKMLKHAERLLERQINRGRGASELGRVTEEVIVHPETKAPAVWFHDDTVEAGKTYRYRMRVKLWNRYVGRMRSLQDPEKAKKAVIAGDWSLESEPITVAPSTHFFFSGSRPPESASVQVWKWRKGRWFEERFDVSVGDVIGGVQKVKTGEFDEEGDEIRADVDFTTGAVVLDLRFDEPVQDRRRGKDGVFGYSERTSSVLTYLDPADGQVKERVLIFDRRNPKRSELEDQVW
jgi:hypothetical protein